MTLFQKTNGAVVENPPSSSRAAMIGLWMILSLLALMVTLNVISEEGSFLKRSSSLSWANNNKKSTTRNSSSSSQKKKSSTKKEDDSDPALLELGLFRVWAYDELGQKIPVSALPDSISELLGNENSNDDDDAVRLARLLSLLADTTPATASSTKIPQVLALGTSSSSSNSTSNQLLESLASIVDEDFLAPRMEWRIVAERFEPEIGVLVDPILHSENYEDDENYDNDNQNSTSIQQNKRNMYGTAGIRAWNSIHDDAAVENNNLNLYSRLEAAQVDFLLVRVQDETYRAVAKALRRYQFPESSSSSLQNSTETDDCERWRQQSLGRTFVRYGGTRDFLGALTITQTNTFVSAIKVGARFIEATPQHWGWVYEFEDCQKANGMECAFLKNYGGSCLAPAVDPSIQCLSDFYMGSLSLFVLPANGIPDWVCQEGKAQAPTPDRSEPNVVASEYYKDQNHGPPEAFHKWCPDADYASKAPQPTREELLDPDLPLPINAVKYLEKIGMEQYVRDPDNVKSSCSLRVPPLRCGGAGFQEEPGEYCCIDEVMIPVNRLATSDTLEKDEEAILQSFLSSYLTRFNRHSRRRIARLHIPRIQAIHARQEGWRQALATGTCATLHIRRGDNIERCANGATHFCSMNRTLADYMNKAVPMLDQLNATHVFVMTDDAEEVTDEKLRPWQDQGYRLEVVSGHNQYSDLTYSDWDPFIESLYTAQACRAVVGHHISTVSKLVYRRMCNRWGECPLVDMNP